MAGSLRPRFVAAIPSRRGDCFYALEEFGDVYEFNPSTAVWSVVAMAPWPRPDDPGATEAPQE